MELLLITACPILIKFCRYVRKLILFLTGRKSHLMVNERIVLGHKISERGIEVDRAKVEAIEKMPCPRDVRGIRSILGHCNTLTSGKLK